MTLDTFFKRIDTGKGVTYSYQKSPYIGGINIWKNEGTIVLTWEESLEENVFNEHNYTKDEIKEFADIASLVEYLTQNQVDPTWFKP